MLLGELLATIKQKEHMISPQEHKLRIKQELLAAGVTNYGLLKPEFRNLDQVIQENEHIEAVVYGRTIPSGGAVLIATDLRAIYYNRIPLFSSLDEVTYDLVSGVSKRRVGGMFSTVTLHTRAGDYSIQYANVASASKFIKFIEQKCIENTPTTSKTVSFKAKSSVHTSSLGPEALTFLQLHEIATLCTIDRSGNLDGSVVYYCTLGKDTIYVVTKGGTQKLRNVFSHSQVALVVFDEQLMQTLQIQALANVETDDSVKKQVFKKIIKQRDYKGQKRWPPVTQMQNESYMVICIQPTKHRYRDFKNFSYEIHPVTGSDIEHPAV